MLKQLSKVSSASALSLDDVSMSAALTKMSAAAAAAESYYIISSEEIDRDSSAANNYDYETTTLGNLSYQRAPLCSDGCFCAASCPDHPLLQKMVRWVKIIARSRHGMTVVFSIIPLLIGLGIGIYLGRKWEQREQERKHQNQSQSTRKAVLSTKSLKWRFSRQLIHSVLHHIVRCCLWLQSSATSLIIQIFAGPRNFCHKQPENNERLQSTAPPEEMIKSEKEYQDARAKLLKDPSRYRQSGVELNKVPKHIAFIMDGNRRYGKSKYNSASRGHVDGGYKLRDMVRWCIEECVQEITVYAFSTENWNRSQTEIDALMSIFCQQIEELRTESVKLQIIVRVMSTEKDPIPNHVKEKLKLLEDDTRNCKGTLVLNVCLSYGSRGEIVTACRALAQDCSDGKLSVDKITEQQFESRLLTHQSPPPDILLRTSGEVRISNFLLWQCAYSEFFFLSKHWPELEKKDLIQVIQDYAYGRKRRFGS